MLQTPIASTEVDLSCAHCGLPVPPGLTQANLSPQFCCFGCATAYQLIHESGLESYYRIVEPLTGPAKFNTSPDVSFQDFDSDSFHQKFIRQDESGDCRVTLSIEGMHCAACIWLIEKLPRLVRGVIQADVNWSRQTVAIQWDPDQVRLSRIACALRQLGYPPHPIRENQRQLGRQWENRRQLIQIGIAAAAAGNNMLIAAALYLGLFSSMSQGIESMLRIASCAVGLVSFLGPGQTFLRGASNALRSGTPHMDLPIALALTVGTIGGFVNTVRGSGEIYFDSLSVLICLLLIGRWIQFRQQNQAADAVEWLYRLTPRYARKIEAGHVIDIPVDELAADDRIEVRPGDLIPADAVVVSGNSHVDQSILTGESRPAEKAAGDYLSAGTKNLTSRLEAVVCKVGGDTRISQIVDMVEQAALDKPKIVQWANRIGGYFVLVVMTLALATLGAWLVIRPEVAVDRAVALLVVACPCALAMATPLAISVALGRLARRQILVKAGDVLQSLSQPGMIWLDKTGTLTRGDFQVIHWYGDRQWIPWISAVEANFNHPIAKAIESLTDQPYGDVRLEHTKLLTGGIYALSDAHSFLIGNRKLIEAHGCTITPHWDDVETDVLLNKLSPCWIAVDGTVVAVAALGDQLQSDARHVVAQLKSLGWTIGILSGDHREVVAEIASQLNIRHFHAEVTPEEKLLRVRQSNQRFQTTVMVGDGVNDCAALAAATVGIAVRNGAEASLAAAPVYLAAGGLTPIYQLCLASRSTTQTIRCNLAASLTYNLIGVGLAMIGWLHPLVAAILMPISSLTVVTLSLQAARCPKSPCANEPIVVDSAR